MEKNMEKNDEGLRVIKIKILDVPVIAFCALLVLIISRAVYSGEASHLRVTIRGPEAAWVFPLDAEESLVVAGVMGETRVVIHNGRAAIVSSPCSGQTCVMAGGLHKNGQWTACLPNGVFLLIEGRVEGSGGDGVDAASW